MYEIQMLNAEQMCFPSTWYLNHSW